MAFKLGVMQDEAIEDFHGVGRGALVQAGLRIDPAVRAAQVVGRQVDLRPAGPGVPERIAGEEEMEELQRILESDPAVIVHVDGVLAGEPAAVDEEMKEARKRVGDVELEVGIDVATDEAGAAGR